MTTALAVINKAMRLLGLLTSGETPTAAETNDGLTSLNSIIDSFAANPAYSYTNLDETFPLVVAKSSYTIGAAGEFSTIRPVRVLAAFTRSAAGVDTQIGIVTEQAWTSIPDKSTTAAAPKKLLYRPDFPLGQILIYPVPTVIVNIHLKTEKVLSQYATLITDLVLPPGYQRLLELSLAIDLAAEYGTKVAPEVIANIKADLVGILRSNAQDLQTSKLQNQKVAPTP